MTGVALLFCLGISFLFSGTEAGILSLNRVRLRHRLKMNDPAARKLQRLVARPERMLVTVLLVTNFMNICALLLLTQLCVHAWGRAGYVFAILIGLPLWQFCLELLPKSLFRRFPYRALAALSGMLRFADIALSPALALGGLVLRLAPRKPEERKLFAAREDFRYLTIESERQGTLLPVEREMIHNVMDLGAAKARDVMVPMERVRTVAASATVQELLELARQSGLDRFPLADRNGHLVATVNVFEVLMEGARKRQVSSYQRRIVTVTPDEEAYSIMKKMRAARATLAAVIDGGKGPVGLVGFEDLAGLLVRVGEKSEGRAKKA
ncbi:MAG TPA: CNNM domain-containing protein [Chthoniobacteraceae bacterium]|jgi:CBS domain containing-hemolysin-like protein|nr:CNNM domain-containing protein [Chthoniobacteraceae bacterium]